MRYPQGTIGGHLLAGMVFASIATLVSWLILGPLNANPGIEHLFAILINLPGMSLVLLAGGDPRTSHPFLALTGIALQWTVVGSVVSWLIGRRNRRRGGE